MSSDVIMLDRIGSTPWGSFGRLQLPNGWHCLTVEPPWRHNAKNESCIPAGEYTMEMRLSALITRVTRNEFKRGWEVTGVPNRDYIMIHPGNFGVEDSDGCILVGRAYAVINCQPGISASFATFKDLMGQLAKRESWRIVIRWIQPEG